MRFLRSKRLTPFQHPRRTQGHRVDFPIDDLKRVTRESMGSVADAAPGLTLRLENNQFDRLRDLRWVDDENTFRIIGIVQRAGAGSNKCRAAAYADGACQAAAALSVRSRSTAWSAGGGPGLLRAQAWQCLEGSMLVQLGRVIANGVNLSKRFTNPRPSTSWNSWETRYSSPCSSSTNRSTSGGCTTWRGRTRPHCLGGRDNVDFLADRV
jgi:hypothetical protein